MVTVVVLLQNPTDNIKQTLESIYLTSVPVQTIILYTFPKEYMDQAQEAIQFVEHFKQSNKGDDVTVIECYNTPMFAAYEQALGVAKHPYIQFLPAGDKYIRNALQKTVNYLDSHKTEADAAYMLRWRTDKKVSSAFSEVIDLNNTKRHLPYEFHSVVFKTKSVKQVGFRTDLLYDAGFDTLIKILLNKMQVCLVKNAVLFTETPLPSNTNLFRNCLYKEWYHNSLEHYMLPLLKYAQEKIRHVPVFMQQILYYELKLKFFHNENNNNHHVIDEDTDSFFTLCHQVLAQISDHVILNRYFAPYNSTSQILKNVFLKLKYEKEYKIDYITGPYSTYMSLNHQLLFHSTAQSVRLDVLEYENDTLQVDASIVGVFDFSVCKIKVLFDEKEVPYEEVYRFAHTKYFGLSASKRYTFHFSISKEQMSNIENGGNLKFFIEYNGIESTCKIATNRYTSKITSLTTYAYWNFDEFTLGWVNEKTLRIQKRSKAKSLVKEIKFLARTLVEPEIGIKMFIIRMAYWFYYPFLHKKNIWITYDKLYKGGDCGEYLYKYVHGKNKNLIMDYVINRKCDDRVRLQKEGYKPLIFGTLKQKMHYLFSSVVLNTHAGTHSFCSFCNNSMPFIQGLIKSDTMCIQHGLTVQQLAFEENQAFNNTKRYFCASKYEIKNLSHPIYGYRNKKCLQLTGIPRYDGLVNHNQKQILITPTWRNYISMPAVMGQSRPYNPHFKDTNYFKIYNSLLTNKTLINCAKSNGYKLIYLLHPVISSQIEDYPTTGDIEVIPATSVNYEKILTESSLMVTDYSGVQFDFAYMKKPVVYFHPPQLPPHYKEGGFFYETMGFGEICKTTEVLVDVLCSYMNTDCETKPKYLERINDFYAFEDLNSCARIYDNVIEYQQEYKKEYNV